MDKMPDEVYVSKQWGGVIGFEPFAGAEKYRRADLPKEVDLKAISKSCALAAQHYPRKITDSYIEEGVLRTIKHLVALGVIKDKGV